MRIKLQFLTIFLSFFPVYSQVSGVGINETIPEQALHLGSQTGTIRVDGLNATNNSYNGGGVDKTYPVYVDNNGDLTLKTTAYDNSDGDDAFLTAAINGTVSIIPIVQADDGYESVEITSYTFTVSRNTILEIKYSLSIEVFQNNLLTILKDQYARNITNFFTLNTPVLAPTTRRYAPSSKCYFNRNDNFTNPAALPDAATGYIYNTGTTYIPLTTGTHTLRLYGTVCSGSNNRATFIRFAGGPDAIFLRLY
ncbi:hypothetical protein [Flavobacterium sp.]|jgi:hypothetical protein|uniref:hypothetical protein n=1 Tax=Flavobacterium sp. TaxID=239 RepID=UPI002A805873|nr:hypothetical protein [Flavobacterium sp.]